LSKTQKRSGSIESVFLKQLLFFAVSLLHAQAAAVKKKNPPLCSAFFDFKGLGAFEPQSAQSTQSKTTAMV